MADQIKAKFIGLDELQATLKKFVTSGFAERTLDEAAALMLNRIRRRFLAQQGTLGQPWIPSYAAIRRKALGRGGGTLFDTGALFHSIQVVNLGPGKRSIGTDIPYAHKHQFGEDGMVRREFIGASPEDLSAIDKLFTKRLAALAQGTGGG